MPGHLRWVELAPAVGLTITLANNFEHISFYFRRVIVLRGGSFQLKLDTSIFKESQKFVVAVSAEADKAFDLRIDQHFSAEDAGRMSAINCAVL